MEEEVSESCFCSETLDIILGIVSGVLQHIVHGCNMFLCPYCSHWFLSSSSSARVTSNTVAPSCPWNLLFQGAPCSSLCSSPSSSPSADGGAPPAWRLDHRRTWRGSLVDQVPNQHGSTCPLSRTFASCSGYDPGRRPCSHLFKQGRIRRYLLFVILWYVAVSDMKYLLDCLLFSGGL